jgi:tetratricopeptide (TPR) repeat protein
MKPLTGFWEPDSPYYLRGMALMGLSRHRDAIPNFLMAQKLNPRSSRNAWALWRVYANLGSWHLAAHLADAYARADGNNAHSNAFSAWSWSEIGHKEESLQRAEKACSLAPKDPLVLSLTGKAYANLGEYVEALKHYNTALDINSEAYEALAWKASLLATCPAQKHRNGREALKLASKAFYEIRLPDWDKWEAAMGLEEAHAECGDFKEALKFAKKSLEQLGPEAGIRAEYEERVRLFEKQMPFRTAPKIKNVQP